MSKTLIVFFELTDAGKNSEALIKEIKEYPGWARLGGSAYLIMTDEEPVKVRDDLKKVLDNNDRIFVGVAPPPSAWKGLPENVSKWILENQK